MQKKINSQYILTRRTQRSTEDTVNTTMNNLYLLCSPCFSVPSVFLPFVLFVLICLCVFSASAVFAFLIEDFIQQSRQMHSTHQQLLVHQREVLEIIFILQLLIRLFNITIDPFR